MRVIDRAAVGVRDSHRIPIGMGIRWVWGGYRDCDISQWASEDSMEFSNGHEIEMKHAISVVVAV